MAYYQEDPTRTQEQIQEYVNNQVQQLLKIQIIWELKKWDNDFNNDFEYWQNKSNEELDAIISEMRNI